MADDHPKPPNPSEFSHIITKIAVSQICQSLGFKGSQSSALNTLTKITTLYLQTLAKSAVSSAALCSGRTECNLYDVVHALEELRAPYGFSGAGNVRRPLLSSSVLRELRLFVSAVDEVPFAGEVPVPPKEMNCGFVGFLDMEEKRGAEVPKWLPGFPEKAKAKRVSKREVWWGERIGECGPVPVAVRVEKEERKGGGGKIVMQGRREKVRFKVGMKNVRVGGDGLELRNGVCRGGKRVCLIKGVSKFGEDDDENEVIDIGNGKLM